MLTDFQVLMHNYFLIYELFFYFNKVFSQKSLLLFFITYLITLWSIQIRKHLGPVLTRSCCLVNCPVEKPVFFFPPVHSVILRIIIVSFDLLLLQKEIPSLQVLELSKAKNLLRIFLVSST